MAEYELGHDFGFPWKDQYKAQSRSQSLESVCNNILQNIGYELMGRTHIDHRGVCVDQVGINKFGQFIYFLFCDLAKDDELNYALLAARLLYTECGPLFLLHPNELRPYCPSSVKLDLSNKYFNGVVNIYNPHRTWILESAYKRNYYEFLIRNDIDACPHGFPLKRESGMSCNYGKVPLLPCVKCDSFFSKSATKKWVMPGCPHYGYDELYSYRKRQEENKETS